MTRKPKSISIRQLQSAVKTALETAKKEHPEFVIDPPDPTGNIPIIFRPGWILGIPVPWPLRPTEASQAVEFSAAFSRSLASTPQIADLGVDGKAEPALYVAGDKGTIGVAAGDFTVTQ